MKRHKARLIGEILQEHLKDLDESGRLAELKALQAFNDAIENGLNKYITQRSIRDGVLFVKVTSSVLRSEMLMNRGNIIARINSTVGTNVVKEIRLY